MKHFLVGGCVRDQVLKDLGYDIPQTRKDIDHVLVDPTPEGLKSLGLDLKTVGHDFPVHIHPVTGEEYALARAEKKTGEGYHGFETWTEGVTLVQDLQRRDLTANAMALDPETGEIIDPWGGQKDLKAKMFRHVSEHFAEDPVRVLKLGRHLAEYPDFRAAPETISLCRLMVNRGDLSHLTVERVTKDLEKALKGLRPSKFFDFLRLVGALEVVLPEIQALIGVEQPVVHHPEGDVYNHTMLVVDHPGDPATRFASLCHDLGKAITPQELWPKHHNHEKTGVPIVETFCERLKVSAAWRDSALLATRYHLIVRKVDTLRAGTILETLKHIDALRRPVRLQVVLAVAAADERGRTGFENAPCEWAQKWDQVLVAIKAINNREISETCLAKGKDVGITIQVAQINAIKEVTR